MRVNRVDRGRVAAHKRTAQGYLRVDGHATRVGIFTYRDQSGAERRELRPPEEVTKADSLATLAGVPVTDDHPDEMLTPENTRQHQRGYTGPTATMDGELVSVPGVTVTDSTLIAKIEGGKQELSCGYACDLDETPGEWRGQRYDAVQRNIVYNHLAVVERGRAGPAARLRLDAAEQQDPDAAPAPRSDKEDPPTMKFTINGVEYDVEPQVAQAITAERTDAQSKLTAAEEAGAAATSRADKAEAARDTEKDRADKAEQARKDDAGKLPDLVKARVALVAQAAGILPKDQVEKLDAMTDADIKKAIVLVASPDAKLDGKSDEYLEARFDGALETLKADATTRNDTTGALRVAATGATTNDRNDAEDPRAAMMKASQEAWKKPLTATKEA